MLLPGHTIGGSFKVFVHQCPGDGCSVKAWLQWKELKAKYDAARLGLKYFGSESEKSSEGTGECVS